MKKLNRILIVSLVPIVLFISSVLAQGSPKLPPGIQALMPQGYELKSPQTFVSGTMGKVEFIASKQIDGRRDVYTSEYHFDLTVMEKPQILVKSQSPIYQKQLEQNSQNDFNDRSQKAEVVDPSVGYDKPQLTKYPWGNGITQRVIHKYMGAGKGSDEIEYSCSYSGLIISGNVFKSFKLLVYGVDTREEADKWANKAAEIIGKTTLGDLNVK
ncbi:MAG TPA: hypothetical protein VHY08_01555 [Bacillota bacterium]|nr:hypothetical protein [Bacillota bacterium]